MPIFIYACPTCGWKSGDKIKPFTVEEIPCEECQGAATRVLSVPGHIKFKGSGWATRRPVEAFEKESEYVEDWGKDE